MEKYGTFTFREMNEASARQIVGWQYEAPYDVYNCNPADSEEIVDWFINPQAHYYIDKLSFPRKWESIFAQKEPFHSHRCIWL